MGCPIKVLHVMTDPQFGPLLLETILRQQRERGYEVEIAVGPGEMMGRLIEMGFPVYTVPLTRRLAKLSHFAATARLVNLMRERRYHVVHLHNPITSVLGRVASRIASVPVVLYHMHGSYWDSPRMMERLVFSMIEKALSPLSDHIFTINAEDAQDLIKKGIKKSESVTSLQVGSGGVSLDRFDPYAFTPEDKVRLRETLGMNSSDFVVGFVGRLVQVKGVADLVEAFRGVAAACPLAKLLLVGGVSQSERDQETGPRVRQMAASDPLLRDRVVFTDFREDVPALMSIMDLLVMPSRQEHFGLVQAEAGAMRLPVISTDTRGGREAIEQGRNGLLVPAGDPPALQRAILELEREPALREGMGQAGQDRTRARYDERGVFMRINAVYAQLLREQGFPVLSDSKEGFA